MCELWGVKDPIWEYVLADAATMRCPFLSGSDRRSDLAQGTGHGGAAGRAHVSDLYGLFTVSMMMFGERDGAAIMRLCASSFPSLGSSRVEAAYLTEADSMVPVDIGREVQESLAGQVAHAGPQGGRLDVDG